MPSEKHQQQAREIAKTAGIPNYAALYPRIIEHLASALEAVERDTRERFDRLMDEVENHLYTRQDMARVRGIVREIRAEFGIAEKENRA